MSSQYQSMHRHLSPGVIAAIVIGAIIFALILCFCTCCCWFIRHFEPCGTGRAQRRAARRCLTEWTPSDRSKIRHWWELTERDLEIVRARQSGIVTVTETVCADRGSCEHVADLGPTDANNEYDVETGLRLDPGAAFGSDVSTIVETVSEAGDGELGDGKYIGKTTSRK